MYETITMQIANREFKNFFDKTETKFFILFNVVFTITLFFMKPNDFPVQFLLAINTSFWAALIYYFLFNVYGNIDVQKNKLLTFKDSLEKKISQIENIFQKFVDEANIHGIVPAAGSTGFLSYVNNFQSGHLPTSNNLRIMKVYSAAGSTYYNIGECCIYEFDRAVISLKELERLSLSLQLRELDPFLYERIYQLAEVKARGRQLLLNGAAFRNPHGVLAGDLDSIVTELKNLINHLNNNWSLEIRIRNDL